MAYTIPSTFGLQSLLFTSEDLSSCLFRKPTAREREFLQFLQAVQGLLTPEEQQALSRNHTRGRLGYELKSILGIQLLKLVYRQPTMKETLLLLQENGNLKDMLALDAIPSQATVSRLSSQVMAIVSPTALHERVISEYVQATDRVIGHLCIDSTTIEAREKPIHRTRKTEERKKPAKKPGRKKNGSPEQQEYLKRKAQEEQERIAYLHESWEHTVSKLEMRCSLTAKQNSKGKRQWFIGYKAHLATDDFGVPMSYVVTGASVHDSKVAVPLMKMTRERSDFFYILLDKGYISPLINDYADHIERKVIIDRKAYQGVAPIPLEPAAAARYTARTTVERTNSELKDGFLPDKIYKQAARARYEIALAILLTTMKKVRNVLKLYDEKSFDSAA